jgi:5-methylcytosine-specific restriction enzyme B
MSIKTPLQKILFGSPGTGKSYKIQTIATEQLDICLSPIDKTLANTVKTVFHPEYTYADFIGKLMPQSQGGNIIYKFYPGHFLKALGNAYRGLMQNDKKHYLLVIDELNRGNASAIFGSIFQLLDRDSDYWSSYEIDLSDLELMALFNIMSFKTQFDNDTIRIADESDAYQGFEAFFKQRALAFSSTDYEHGSRLSALLSQGKISIPPNLSILATINTSDESIYYLDSAFKRRWDWEYVGSPQLFSTPPDSIRDVLLVREDGQTLQWSECIQGINHFICSNSQNIRRIEDKQIGWWFIKPENQQVTLQQVRDKLMFYLWDSVFAKDRRPLESVIAQALDEPEIRLVTFADFLKHSAALMKHFQSLGAWF